MMRRAILFLLFASCASAQVPALPPLGPQIGHIPHDASVLPLHITTASCPTIITGQPYQCQFTATGGTQPYHWSLISGIMPPGLTLSDSGLLSGTVYVCSDNHPINCFIVPPQEIQLIMTAGKITIPVRTPKKKKKVA